MKKEDIREFQGLAQFFLPILIRDVFITPAILLVGFGVLLLVFTVIYFVSLVLGDSFLTILEGLVVNFFDGKSYQGSLGPTILKVFSVISFVFSVLDFLYFRLKGRVLLSPNKAFALFFVLGCLGYLSFFFFISAKTDSSSVDLYVTMFFLGLSLVASLVAYVADRLFKVLLRVMDSCRVSSN